LTLQQQLSLEVSDDADDDGFNSRLSRVVTKLFARVVKAEEGVADPFSSDLIDLEALICSMEDLLVAAETRVVSLVDGSSEACYEMVKTLVLAIMNAHQGSAYLRAQMEELGIDPHTSALGTMIALCDEDGTDDDLLADISEEPVTTRTLMKGPSKDISSLVSTLASASQGDERDGALEALRRYKDIHGDEELSAHLEQVSSPFRAYIEEQLGEYSGPQKQEVSGGSMSERLRHLRTRLQATELVVQTALEEKSTEPYQEPDPEAPSPSRLESPTKIPSPSIRSSRLTQPSSKIVHPTPSKLVLPSQSKIPSTSTVSSQTLRERLAEAQENRKTAPSSTASSLGRAAALRARLEAVKSKAK
jgi:hypothetical protein